MYLNPSPEGFRKSLNSEIYIDKSPLIAALNKRVGDENCYVCVSRPRRFGKSHGLKMLAAYYQCERNTHNLFNNLKIAQHTSYETHINKYEVVLLNMQTILSEANGNAHTMTANIERSVTFELIHKFGKQLTLPPQPTLVETLSAIEQQIGRQFIFLIDEWDCLMRETKNQDQQRHYLDFLRKLLKDQPYIALAYMTGILPIKKYGTHSTLNMFDEYSITNPNDMAEYFGFTQQEVAILCHKYTRNYEEVCKWYDGYELELITQHNNRTVHIFNPNSVVRAMHSKITNYWGKTEQMEALQIYIDMDYDGLRDTITRMIACQKVDIDIRRFSNDMQTFASKDDILTLLIHLGYLTYNGSQAYIPNYEVAQEFERALTREKYPIVAEAIEDSRRLIQAIWQKNEAYVCSALQRTHEKIPIFNFNDENSLSCAIMLAMFSAQEYYSEFRELPTGQGFADVVFLPRPMHANKPAIIVELKWDKTAQTAITQIKAKNYPARLEGHKNKLLLVSVNYDKDTREYECQITHAIP